MPSSSTTNIIKRKNLNYLEIKTIADYIKKIRDWIDNENNNTPIKSMTGVYDISRMDCNKQYVGETLRVLKKWIHEHISDLKKKGNMNNRLVKLNLETRHNFNFNDSKMVPCTHNKNYLKMVESSIISNHKDPAFSINLHI